MHDRLRQARLALLCTACAGLSGAAVVLGANALRSSPEHYRAAAPVRIAHVKGVRHEIRHHHCAAPQLSAADKHAAQRTIETTVSRWLKSVTASPARAKIAGVPETAGARVVSLLVLVQTSEGKKYGRRLVLGRTCAGPWHVRRFVTVYAKSR
jgi:hypothetical protein